MRTWLVIGLVAMAGAPSRAQSKFPARGTPARVTYPMVFEHGEPAGP